jgi:hypothetical protein
MHWHPTAAPSTLQHIVWGEGLEEAAELGVVGPIETGQSLEREGVRTTAYNRELPRESGERDAFEMLDQSRSRHRARMKAERAFDTAALYDMEADAVAASAPLNPIRPSPASAHLSRCSRLRCRRRVQWLHATTWPEQQRPWASCKRHNPDCL